jgi:NodT family efflux transporter outer membrane factor (OMF) lipoprotein
MKNNFVFLFLLYLSLSACKDVTYLTPNLVKVPKNYSQNSLVASNDSLTQTDTTGLLAYRNFFKDSLLVALIDTALLENQDIKIALARLEQARAEVRLTKGIQLPEAGIVVNNGVRKFGDYTIDGVGNYDTQFSPNLNNLQQIPNPIPEYYAGVYSSWELDLWGKLKSKKKAAKERFLSSEEAKNIIISGVVTTLSQAYLTLVTLDREVEIIRQNIALQESSLAMVEAQLLSGHTTALAIQLMSAQLLNARNLLIGVEQQILEKENEINQLLGRYPAPVLRSSSLPVDSITAAIEIGVPAALLQRRPDIRSAEHNLLAYNADLKSARAAFYPSVQLTGTMGLQSFRANVFFDLPASLAFNVLGGLTQPLFNRRLLKAQLMEQNGRQKEAYVFYEKTVLSAFTEVYQLLQMRENLQKMSALKEEEVRTLTASVNSAKDLFFSGRCTYLEINTAQANLLETQIELINLWQRIQVNQIGLYKAIGGAWY